MSKLDIYVFPFDSSDNQYVQLNKMTWQAMGHQVLAINELSLGAKHSVAILNWFEDQWTTSQKSRFLSWLFHLLKLIRIRICASKIVWVRHNVVSHSKLSNPIYRWMNGVMMALLHRLSDERVTHRPFAGFSYVPHPTYSPQAYVANHDRDIEYLYFGVVSKYKGLVELLGSWPVDAKLTMLGKSKDPQLAADIEQLIKKRNLSVEWRNEFTPDEQLNHAIGRSKYVIIPHQDGSMIVSGAFFHAISLGANVVVKQNAFSDWLVTQHPFVSQYDDSNLNSVLTSASYIAPQEVIEDAERQYGRAQLIKNWQKVLSWA